MGKNIAFIGLGHMGGPMAANLVAAGHHVTGFDLVPEAIDRARSAGITIAASAAQAATGAEVVITMLPAGKHVLSVYQGQAGQPGLLAAADPGTLFLECSTIAVDDARQAHKLADQAGQLMLDAPVSGGTGGATNATLTFMVGGAETTFRQAQDILEIMGQRIVHCGAAGAGQAAKVCNNMILGIAMIAVSEAFVLGEQLGLSNEALYNVASTASGQCWALTTNCPVPGPVPTSPANRDYQPGFAGSLMAKDLDLALQAISSSGVDARLGITAEEIYREWSAGDGASQDFSGIINRIRSASLATAAGSGNQ